MLKIKWLAFGFLVCMCLSCEEKSVDEELLSSELQFNFGIKSAVGNEVIQRVDAFLLNEDVLTQKYMNMTESGIAGQYRLTVDKVAEGHLFFFANSELLGLDAFTIGATTLTELNSAVTPIADFQSAFPLLYYISALNINAIKESVLDVSLQRSVARLDLHVQPEIEIVIDSCRISNIVDRSFILPGRAGQVPGIQKRTMKVEGTDLTEKVIEGFAYLYESSGIAPTISFYTRIQGVKNKLVVTLPENIERNKKYRIDVTSRGATLYANLTVLPWEDGSNSEAKPDPFAPQIDLKNSVIPDYVSVNVGADTLSVPSTETNVVVAIQANVATGLVSEDPTIGIEPMPATRSAEGYINNRFKLKFGQRKINDREQNVKIYVRDESASQHYNQYFVINRKANRVRFTNMGGTVGDVNISYSQYTDGLLGQMIVDRDVATVECLPQISGESSWIQLNRSGNTYQVQGGFKPNDRDARGQVQTAHVTVNFPDGVTEKYDLSRARTSLPVVQLGSRYWTKYSLQGQAKTVTDQVGFDRDQEDLWGFLKSCTSDEYYSYCGDAYKGVSPVGMRLSKNAGGQVIYTKYASMADGDIFNTPATTLCPAGYAIPTAAEFNQIFPATNLALNVAVDDKETSNTYQVSNRSYTIQRYKRSTGLIIDGVQLNAGIFLRIKEESTGNYLVINDIGHQYDADKLAAGAIILTTINTSFSYRTVNHSSNSIGMGDHNGTKTRTVRCIKTPVTYIMP